MVVKGCQIHTCAHTLTHQFLIPALFLCRQIYLPGRRPRDRKKKDWKKKDVGDLCLKDIMLEEGPQNLGQDYWSTSFVEDLDSTQTEAIKARREDLLSPLAQMPPMPPKPPVPLGTQTYDQKNQDQHIPVPLGTFSLEKVEEYDKEKIEKAFQTPGDAQQPKEELDSVSAGCLVTEKKNLVGIVTEGMPVKEGKDYSAMPVKENRQSGNPELLSPLLQDVACEKEGGKGGTCADSLLEGELKQDNQYAPLQEPKEPTDLEQLHSILVDNEKKSQEEQINTCTDSEGVTSLQELLGQPGVPCTEEQKLLEQEPVTGVIQEVEEEVTWGQMDSIFEGKKHKKSTDGGDTPHKEAKQPGELQFSDILPTQGASDKPEQQGALCHLDFVSEISSQKSGQDLHDLSLLEQEDKLPIIPKATSFSFQDLTYEKKQTEVQDIRNYTSDTILSKGEDHQSVPNQVDRQAASSEKISFSLGTTYTADMQRPSYSDCVAQDTALYINRQRQSETQNLIFGQQIRTPHCNTTEEKEEQEGLDHAYFESRGIICIEEQEFQEPVIVEDVGLLADNLSFDKEQQRKLDCGDTGPESICDKDDQDPPPAFCLDVQDPLVLEKLSSLSLSETSEAQCIRKDSSSAHSLEMPCLDEQQAERDTQSQSQMLIFASSKERIPGPEQASMAPLVGCSTEGATQEAWYDQKATAITYEEQKHKEQSNLGMTCEEHHKKEKQGLSSTTFPCNIKEDEGHL